MSEKLNQNQIGTNNQKGVTNESNYPNPTN